MEIMSIIFLILHMGRLTQDHTWNQWQNQELKPISQVPIQCFKLQDYRLYNLTDFFLKLHNACAHTHPRTYLCSPQMWHDNGLSCSLCYWQFLTWEISVRAILQLDSFNGHAVLAFTLLCMHKHPYLCALKSSYIHLHM